MSRPAPVRRLASATTDAVAAAAARDAAALAEAGAALGAVDPELVRVVVGHALGAAMAATHPGGLDGDDVAAVLTATVQGAAPWWPVDPDVALAVLLGSLGAHAEEQEVLDARLLAEHAALVLAQVLGPGAARRLTPHLDAALVELERAQSVEMP